jgi:tetratricopeptide (TPR) repeat protein
MDFKEFDIEFLAQKLAENPQSPIFARLADLYIDTQKAAEAIQLCNEGIKLFPDYYAGYLVLGKAYLSFNEYSKARESFEKVLELCPFNHFVEKLLLDVHDKPDESTRITDASYFTEQPKPPENFSDNTFSDSGFDSAQSTTVDSGDQPLPSLFDMVSTEGERTPDEILSDFTSPTQSSNEFPQQSPISQERTSISDAFSSTDFQQQETIIPPKQYSPVVEYTPKPVPLVFDEYFNQRQAEIANIPTISLDEYLHNAIPADIELLVAQEIQQRPVMQKTLSHEQSQYIDSIVNAELSGQMHPEAEQQFVEPTFEEIKKESTAPQQESSTDFDMLTEKLQNAERIKPQENYQPQQQMTSQEEQTAYESDMVTPTLAEIYASQGEYGAAIQAYEILQFSKPEQSGSYQQRIRELQQKRNEKEGLI